MLGSDRMRSLLPELQREFDYVLIDAPSMGSGDDSVMLGRSAEGVILVLKANLSRREIGAEGCAQSRARQRSSAGRSAEPPHIPGS